jgi:large subunit ribosomal protein L29
MSAMKKKGLELKDLTEQELQDKLQEERGTLTKLRFNHTVSPIESPMQLRAKRKDVARILTELRKRELTNQSK